MGKENLIYEFGIDIAKNCDKAGYYKRQCVNVPVKTYFVIAKDKKEFIFYKKYLKDKFGYENKYVYLSHDRYIDGLNTKEVKIIRCGQYWHNQIEKSKHGQMLLKWFEENNNLIEFKID